MLSLQRIGLYTIVSAISVVTHNLLRFSLLETSTRWVLGLAVLYAFKVLEARKRLSLKDKHSYYVPLGVMLLLLGEAAEAMNVAVSKEPDAQGVQHRSAVHASLAFSLVAECEWWREFHPEAYHEKLAMPDLDSITTRFPGGRWANRLYSAAFNLMSVIIWFTIFLSLGWLAAFALYQDGRGVAGLFFVNRIVTPGWFYFQVLLCSPLMLLAKLIHGEIEKRILPRDELSVKEEEKYMAAVSGIKKVDSSQSLV